MRLIRVDPTTEEHSPFFSSPHKDLLLHLIDKALIDLKHPRQSIRRDAKRWIFSEDITPFSLRWCLQQLDVIGTEAHIRTRAMYLLKEVGDT